MTSYRCDRSGTLKRMFLIYSARQGPLVVKLSAMPPNDKKENVKGVLCEVPSVTISNRLVSSGS